MQQVPKRVTVLRSGPPVADASLPSRRAVRAAYASAFSATVGFVPLHSVWAIGIPIWVDENKFRDWYAVDGVPTSSCCAGWP